MRAERQKIKLLEEGGASEEDILAAKARYKSTSHEYSQFSKAMDLPQQRQRVYTGTFDKNSGSGIMKEREMLPRKMKNGNTAVDWSVVQSNEYFENLIKYQKVKRFHQQ